MPGTKDNPVRLDIFQTIRNVGWLSGTAVLMLIYNYRSNIVAPIAQISQLPFIGGSYDIMVPLTFNDGIENPPVEPPITPEMAAHLYAWNPEPPEEIGPNPDNQRSGSSAFVLNVDRIKEFLQDASEPPESFSFRFAVPSSGPDEVIHTTQFYIWDSSFGATSLEENSANPFQIADGRPGHEDELISMPFPCADEEEQTELMAVGFATRHPATVESEFIIPRNFEWDCSFQTLIFSNGGTISKDFVSIALSEEETKTEGRTVTITCQFNPALALTMDT